MCNFGVRSRFLDVIYGVRPPNGSPVIKYGRKLKVNLLLFFFRISVKTAFIVPKIVFIKEPLISRESARGGC